jgi:hypothetical protein
MFHHCAFTCVRLSRRPCCGSHLSIPVGHDMLYELVLFIQCHVANIMTEVAVLAGVASLATSVAGHCGRVLCLGAVNVPGVDWG